MTIACRLGLLATIAMAMLSVPASAAVTFSPVVPYQAAFSSGADDVDLADVNTDGRLDVIVAQPFNNSVGVFLGAGDGTVAARKDSPAGSTPVDVAVGDLDGDGTPDVAVANAEDLSFGKVSILRGKGDGTFDVVDQHEVGYDTNSVVIADFDRDGKPDIGGASFSAFDNSQEVLAFLRGRGDGTVEAPVFTSVKGFPASLSTADFNRDGAPDLA